MLQLQSLFLEMLLFRFGFFTLLLLLATPAFARSGRQNLLPHGNSLQCAACHTEPNRGITNFGFDSYAVLRNGAIDWAALSAMDSDKDGYSNGVELGDPNGNWRPGMAQPSGAFWNPGVKNENPCGNDNLESVEDCDGGVDNTVTCQSLGLGIGTVRCSNLCKFETSFCVVCGDDKINPNLEECEGSDFGGESCRTLGFKAGNLTCNAECEIDDSGCSGVSDDCGDDQLQSPEECDGNQLGGKTCALLGFDGGPLNCSAACRHDTSQCFGDQPPTRDMGSMPTYSGTDDPPTNEVLGKGSCSTNGHPVPFTFGIVLLLGLSLVVRRKTKK